MKNYFRGYIKILAICDRWVIQKGLEAGLEEFKECGILSKKLKIDIDVKRIGRFHLKAEVRIRLKEIYEEGKKFDFFGKEEEEYVIDTARMRICEVFETILGYRENVFYEDGSYGMVVKNKIGKNLRDINPLCLELGEELYERM